MTTNNVVLTIFLIYITGYIFCYYFIFLFEYLSNKEHRDLIYTKNGRTQRFNLSFFWLIIIPFAIICFLFEIFEDSKLKGNILKFKNKILNSQSKWF